MNTFAHAGEAHTEQIEIPQTMQEAPSYIGANLPHDVWVGCALIIGAALVWVIAGLLKWNLAVKVLLITAGLLIVGVTTYQFAPTVSTIALAVGMALSLLGVLAQLSVPRRRAKE